MRVKGCEMRVRVVWGRWDGRCKDKCRDKETG